MYFLPYPSAFMGLRKEEEEMFLVIEWNSGRERYILEAPS